MTGTSYRPAPSTLGPIWRDANVRTAPSLDSSVVELLLPDGTTSHTALGWALGEEIVEGENPAGEIVSCIWFKFSDGRWCSAVNFDPAHLRSVLGDAAPLIRPHTPAR